MADEKKKVLTRKGYEELVEQLDFLKTVRRDQISEAIAVARGFGDLSENAEYDEARKDQARNESEISRIEAELQNCEIVEENEINTDVIGVGNTVKVMNLTDNMAMTLSIVGANETDPRNMKISTESPIGAGLLGKKVGDKASIVVPSGTKIFEVLEISR